MTGLRDILEHPQIYQAFQTTFGFFNARVFAAKDFLKIQPGQKVLDIGCGPGFIVEHLPVGVEYIGFDIDERYIEYARKRFGHRAQFHCRYFDAECSREFSGADIAMMNGVVHHLSDELAMSTLRTIRFALKPGGLLFTLDGCYRPNQNKIAKYLLDHDRGQFVRSEEQYRGLFLDCFANVETKVFENLSRLPYTFIFGLLGDGRPMVR